MAPVLASLAKLSSTAKECRMPSWQNPRYGFQCGLPNYYILHLPGQGEMSLSGALLTFPPSFFMMKHVCFTEGLSVYWTVNALHLLYKPSLLMLYKARVTVCSEIYTQHTNIM